MSAARPVVLYAEDSEDDVFLMQRAFRNLNFAGSLVVVPNGADAMAYLDQRITPADSEAGSPPSLVLLDIKMPQVGGFEVLRWIRGQERFNNLPVLMLTSSSQESDVSTAHALGADGYLVKPASLDTFRALVDDLTAVCRSPHGREAAGRVRGAIPPPQGETRGTN
jgi:two-component system, response regulator